MPERRARTLASLLAAVLAVLVLLAACSEGTPSGPEKKQTLRVSADAALTEALQDLVVAYADTHPDVVVQTNVAGSSSLVVDLLSGREGADVLLTADAPTMELATRSGKVQGRPRVFAADPLALLVPKGNPAGVTGVADLSRPELRVGLCGDSAPCGRQALELIGAAGVLPVVDVTEADASSLAFRLTSGDLDVALAYRSLAVESDGAIEALPLDDALQPDTRFYAAPVRTTDRQAAAFAAFLRSPAAQRVLADHGFTSG